MEWYTQEGDEYGIAGERNHLRLKLSTEEITSGYYYNGYLDMFNPETGWGGKRIAHFREHLKDHEMPATKDGAGPYREPPKEDFTAVMDRAKENLIRRLKAYADCLYSSQSAHKLHSEQVGKGK